MLNSDAAYDAFVTECKISLAGEAGVETSYIDITNATAGTRFMVSTTAYWTEGHLSAGASPNDFLFRAAADPSQLFAGSSLLAPHPVSLLSMMAAGDPITIPVSSYPPPPPPCIALLPCFPGVQCVDDSSAPAGYTCGRCAAGYEGDGQTCTDVDECFTGGNGTITSALAYCDPLTTCSNFVGGFECSQCPAGYSDIRSPGGAGVVVCVDIDECSEHHGGCDFAAACINSEGGFACGACPAGFSGSGLEGCQDIDECADARRGGCAPQAECINQKGGSSCGPCQPTDLFNGDGYECRQTSISCADENGGCDLLSVCEESADGGPTRCGACPAGMSGTGSTRCEEIDGCGASPCFDGVECSDIPAPGVGAVCGGCPEGLVGDGRACELDACSAEPPPCSMDPPVPCTNMPGGGVACAGCPPGYTGEGTTCADVDECAFNNGGCHFLSTCVNERGGFACGSCPPGYIGSGSAGCRRATGSCADGHGGCDPMVSCSDAGGVVVCGECPEGYAGDGLLGCSDIDGCAQEASSGGCYPGVHCEDIPAPGQDGANAMGYRCGACPVGMVGDGAACAENKCHFSNGGCDSAVSCSNDPSHPTGRVCGRCPVGYTDEFTGRDGTKCEDADGCHSAPCPALRVCTDVPARDEAGTGAAYLCGACPAGYLQVGEACVDVDECASEDNGGCWMTSDGATKTACINVPGGYSCGGCPEGMRGSGLSGCMPVTSCSDNNGGCWVGVGSEAAFSALCTQAEVGPECGGCPPGFEGEGMSGCSDIDGCAAAPCFPGVACTDTPAPAVGYSCGACPEGYRGNGEDCTLCRMLVGIQHTTAVNGAVDRAGWNLGRFVQIGGVNKGLDSAECVNTRGTRFWWSGAVSNGDLLALDAARNKAETLTLKLPKMDLQVGLRYTFRLSAAMVGNAAVAADATSAFIVLSQPLVVIVRGGGVSTGEASPITLDAHESMDPDGAPGNISFIWRCFRPDPPSAPQQGAECRFANGTLLPQPMGPGAELPAMLLQGDLPPVNYTFLATGRKGSRSSEASVRVTVARGSPPVPTITPLLSRVNAGDRLRLESVTAAADLSSLAHEWTMASQRSSHVLALEPPSPEVDASGAGAATGTLACASRFQPNLVLQADVLTPGSEYTFRLSASDAFGTGAAEITVRVNIPPKGGWVYVSPPEGVAYSDKFSVSTRGWEDEDAPLLFQIECLQIAESGGGAPIVLLDFSPFSGPSIRQMPVEGLPAQGHNVTIRATARDDLGAQATAEGIIKVRPPQEGSAVDWAGSLVSSAAEALLNGDTEDALVQVDGASGLIEVEARRHRARQRLLQSADESGEGAGGNGQRGAEDALRAELLGYVAAAREAFITTSSAVERLARSMQSLAMGAGREPGTDAQSMALLEALVGDTRADPDVAALTSGAAQSICSGLSALSETHNASRARHVAAVMAQMAQSMLYGVLSGEEGREVDAEGLAMMVQRTDGSDLTSSLYASPVATEGAAVSFPAAFAGILAGGAGACNRSGTCQSGKNSTFTLKEAVDVDARLMVSLVDPHAAELDARAAATSAVTTITLSKTGAEEEMQVQDLSEALIFSLALVLPSAAAGEGFRGPRGGQPEEAALQGTMRCAFWNSSLGRYATHGCTQLPNPAPPGAVMQWRSRHVADLPGGLETAWILEPGNVTSGCIETFNATFPEYGGADAGLRKYLPEEARETPAKGSSQHGTSVTAPSCQLALPHNDLGCWWNWTHQIFSGPRCKLSAELQCYCTHLTDFKAEHEVEVQSVEPPKLAFIGKEAFTSLTFEDVRGSTLLMTIVFGIMGGAVYLALCSSLAHHQERCKLLDCLTASLGTGKYAFRLASTGAWTWSLFGEDHCAARITLRHRRIQRWERTAEVLEWYNKKHVQMMTADQNLPAATSATTMRQAAGEGQSPIFPAYHEEYEGSALLVDSAVLGRRLAPFGRSHEVAQRLSIASDGGGAHGEVAGAGDTFPRPFRGASLLPQPREQARSRSLDGGEDKRTTRDHAAREAGVGEGSGPVAEGFSTLGAPTTSRGRGVTLGDGDDGRSLRCVAVEGGCPARASLRPLQQEMRGGAGPVLESFSGLPVEGQTGHQLGAASRAEREGSRAGPSTASTSRVQPIRGHDAPPSEGLGRAAQPHQRGPISIDYSHNTTKLRPPQKSAHSAMEHHLSRMLKPIDSREESEGLRLLGFPQTPNLGSPHESCGLSASNALGLGLDWTLHTTLSHTRPAFLDALAGDVTAMVAPRETSAVALAQTGSAGGEKRRVQLGPDGGRIACDTEMTVLRRLRVRMRAAGVMIRLLQEKQDLNHSRNLCALLGLSLTATQLNVPIMQLREMARYPRPLPPPHKAVTESKSETGGGTRLGWVCHHRPGVWRLQNVAVAGWCHGIWAPPGGCGDNTLWGRPSLGPGRGTTGPRACTREAGLEFHQTQGARG
ncbi:hypothetical protein CYMTET_28436 [Cymbomonas tetramitiformis]|uniref:EGF-like domain-containing protein n=1 Tax=Cymbomonas tetramitiformis TaxID=36881 RepID=A0AAE0KW67_9CHLO|nr:hypothetical protein CYMTET_28436 [Cymbomonas tetramitiformis]